MSKRIIITDLAVGEIPKSTGPTLVSTGKRKPIIYVDRFEEVPRVEPEFKTIATHQSAGRIPRY